MNLSDDILGRLVQISPREFLGVSRGLNAAANAEIASQRPKIARSHVSDWYTFSMCIEPTMDHMGWEPDWIP